MSQTHQHDQLEGRAEQMAYQLPSDVKKQIDNEVSSGHYTDRDQVVREAMAALKARDENIQAINESLDDIDAGDPGKPVSQVFAELRQRHRIPNE